MSTASQAGVRAFGWITKHMRKWTNGFPPAFYILRGAAMNRGEAVKKIRCHSPCFIAKAHLNGRITCARLRCLEKEN
jgi:hypothetical protein